MVQNNPKNKVKSLIAAGAIAPTAEQKQYYLLELAKLLEVNLDAVPVETGQKPYPDPTSESEWRRQWS